MLFYGTYLSFFPLWKTKFCIQKLHWKIGLNVSSLDLVLYLQWNKKYMLVMWILSMLVVLILIVLSCTISKYLFVVYHMMNELAGQLLHKCIFLYICCWPKPASVTLLSRLCSHLVSGVVLNLYGFCWEPARSILHIHRCSATETWVLFNLFKHWTQTNEQSCML